MVDVFVNLLEDAEQELALGEETAPQLKQLGDKIRDKLYLLSEALPKLEKKGWTWSTGAKDVYLHKKSASEETAKEELTEAGIPEDLFHFVH
jgi:hypothetical protein